MVRSVFLLIFLVTLAACASSDPTPARIAGDPVALATLIGSWSGHYESGATGHLERGTRTPIIADGEWHLYEWNLDDDTQWDGFAGTGVNGAIDAATVTIDALYIDATLAGDGSDQDATFNIDTVAHDPAGQIVIPEPTSLALLGLGALPLVRRRRA